MKMILFFKSRTFWFNLILAFVFLISLMLPMNRVLKQITGHGEIQNVPDVRNITLKEAQQTLEDMKLLGEVLDSSAFFKNFKPGTVVQQYPEPGAGAKVGRKIKLTINRHRAESVYLPILTERTFERAALDLRSRGLVLGKVSYKPDLAEGIVLGAKANGKFINESCEKLEFINNEWRVKSNKGTYKFEQIVISTGPWSKRILSELGYEIPLAWEKGYHHHFSTKKNIYTYLIP